MQDNTQEPNSAKKPCRKKWLIPAILGIFAIGAGAAFFIGSRGGAPSVPEPPVLEIADGQEWNGKLPQNGEQSRASSESIEIPGYAEMYLDKDNKEILLINPKGNTVYFVYTVNDESGNKIYETKAIEPNKAVSVNLYDELKVGEHKLSFVIATYDIETKAPCNGATQEVTVIIK